MKSSRLKIHAFTLVFFLIGANSHSNSIRIAPLMLSKGRFDMSWQTPAKLGMNTSWVLGATYLTEDSNSEHTHSRVSTTHIELGTLYNTSPILGIDQLLDIYIGPTVRLSQSNGHYSQEQTADTGGFFAQGGSSSSWSEQRYGMGAGLSLESYAPITENWNIGIKFVQLNHYRLSNNQSGNSQASATPYSSFQSEALFLAMIKF